MSGKGKRPDPQNTAALEKFREPPRTIGELHSLLGFFGYYRNYVQNFSRKFLSVYKLLKSPAGAHREGTTKESEEL